MRTRILALGILLAAAAAACGGGSSSSNNDPAPPTTPPPSGTNPCANIAAEAPDDTARAEPSPAELAKREPRFCRYRPNNVLDALWTHRAAAAGRAGAGPLPDSAADDVGEIVVIQDAGDIMIPVNAFDLKGTAVAFARNAAGGYDARRGDPQFRQTLGQRVTLGDDQSASFTLPFQATFYGQAFTTAFLNSDGNVTFGDADFASTDRSVTRFLTGPPRVALFFADLDPSAGGGVFVNTQADLFTVTWCNVPGFEESRKVTAQLVFQRDGQVEFKFADTTTLPVGVVGLSPGQTTVFAPVDLARAQSGTVDGGVAAVGERFAEELDIDLAALGQAFYRTHGDLYDQLVVWSDRKLVSDAFAYETTIANDIRGIGASVFNASAEFGSAGRLSSIAFMDDLAKYPADPTLRFAGENSTLGLIGHESGHRWLVNLKFRESNGTASGAWLGRDEVHWSFFFDSDASFVEGNDIADLGGGAFRTAAAVERYSALDQYAMGLRDAADVPPVFYVDSPTNVVPSRDNASNPRVGVTFNGTRRSVLIQDVVDAMGTRVPSAAESPKLHRQAFLYVVGPGQTADPAAVARIDRYRREWEPFFLKATDGRMRVDTRLRP